MFSLVVLMLLGCLSREAWTCTCGPRHPQSVYCDSQIVFRAKFMGQKPCAERNEWTEYEIKATKIFKAPEDIDDIQFVYSSKMESMCGYQHPSNNKSEEFLVAGNMMDDKVYINSCSFVVPWAGMSLSQKRGFLQVYAKHCNCKVKQCYEECSLDHNLQCLWTDPMMRKKSQYPDYQAVNLGCVFIPDVKEDYCTWRNLKSRVFSTTTANSRRSITTASSRRSITTASSRRSTTTASSRSTEDQ